MSVIAPAEQNLSIRDYAAGMSPAGADRLKPMVS
jgi:hypothetical protein